MKNELTAVEKKNLNRIFWRSGRIFGSFNMVKMMGQGFGYTMNPIINDLYKGDENNRIAALERHTEFFNTHACAAGFIMGLTYAMEQEKQTTQAVDDSMITNVKTALMGPLAGIGDSLFFNTIRIIAAGIAISLCATGNPLGVLIFILLYGGLFMVIKYYLIHYGYTLGTGFIEKAFTTGILKMLTKAAAILGLVMVGAMVATFINVTTPLTLQIGDAPLKIQSVLDSIMPGLLSLILLFLVYKGLKKGYKATTIVLLILLFGIIGALIGFF